MIAKVTFLHCDQLLNSRMCSPACWRQSLVTRDRLISSKTRRLHGVAFQNFASHTRVSRCWLQAKGCESVFRYAGEVSCSSTLFGCILAGLRRTSATAFAFRLLNTFASSHCLCVLFIDCLALSFRPTKCCCFISSTTAAAGRSRPLAPPLHRSFMSVPAVTETLAFRYPNKVDGCTCPICLRSEQGRTRRQTSRHERTGRRVEVAWSVGRSL